MYSHRPPLRSASRILANTCYTLQGAGESVPSSVVGQWVLWCLGERQSVVEQSVLASAEQQSVLASAERAERQLVPQSEGRLWASRSAHQ